MVEDAKVRSREFVDRRIGRMYAWGGRESEGSNREKAAASKTDVALARATTTDARARGARVSLAQSRNTEAARSRPRAIARGREEDGRRATRSRDVCRLAGSAPHLGSGSVALSLMRAREECGADVVTR